jgi:hypothetical protein
LGLHLLKYSIKEYLKENTFPNYVTLPLSFCKSDFAIIFAGSLNGEKLCMGI